jgi:hypothetical protein
VAAQLPLQQAGVAPLHVVPFCHVPVASQTCVPLPAHCVAPGEHTAHLPCTQYPLPQSVLTPHSLPRLHFAHVPPQSTSVSAPFRSPSLHEMQRPAAEQVLLAQSALAVQSLPSAQRAHVVEPPQSTSVSPPFFTASVHVAARHTLLVHTPLTQSPASAQPWLALQRGQVPPPQSTSVSAPFFTVSVQVGV